MCYGIPSGREGPRANPTDRGMEGTERSLLTEGYGVPTGVVVLGVHSHDIKPVESTLRNVVEDLPKPLACACITVRSTEVIG